MLLSEEIQRIKTLSGISENIVWHGSPSGDLRGGISGLHVGTKLAARQALEARIGIKADGTDWDGTQEYGKTLLAGKKTIARLGKDVTGQNCNAPDEDYYPTRILKYADGTNMPMTVKPELKPYKIIGVMSNTINNPYQDFRANGMMKGQLKKGNAKRGYYYKNDGEDVGSISAVLPGPGHLEKLS